VADSLGIAPTGETAGLATGGGSLGGGGVPGTDYSIFTGGTPTDVPDPVPDATISPAAGAPAGGAGGLPDQLSNWLTKNPAQAAMLGLAAKNALTQPKLPSALQTVQGNAGPAADAAQAIIQSGGTSSPIWQSQKASIDASIDQQLQDQTAAIQQNAANTGQAGMVVQQQINQIKENLETQRQQLYAQAQQQNVNNAVSELTGANQSLTAVANTQLAQSEEAQQSASQTAQLALMLSQMSNNRTTTPTPAS
jgi:hypothetical protein